MKKILSLVLALALVLVFAACGETPQGDGNDQILDGEGAIERPVVTVSSIDEFFDAIACDTVISVEPGYYNISDYLERVYNSENSEAWDNAHPYLVIEPCYDGLQCVIKGISGLTIIGASDAIQDTEFVIEPRYANVFYFKDCDGIQLNNLTAGHTDTGECVGDVVYMNGCYDVSIIKADLYGCGVNGITAIECNGLDVYETTVHDCSWAALEIENCRGQLHFEKCNFVNNCWGLCDYDNDTMIEFNRCSFGQNESNSVAFNEDIILTDCEVLEPTEYPDYSDGDYYPDYPEYDE